MYELFITLVFFASLIGMGVIIFRKIPILVDLPEFFVDEEKRSLIQKLKKKIKRLNVFKGFSYEIFLQKILTKIRILSLKTDNKTFNWLQKLREKYHKKKIEKNDNYWEEIKKEIKNKK